MGVREWADAEYSRIYWTVIDDEKFATVFDDDRRWAAYTRLLMAAEATYPSPAAIPRWVADDVLEHLEDVRIIEIVRGTSYRIVGLQAEREGRVNGRAIGGKKRADGAERDEFGHFLPGQDESSKTPSNVNAGSSIDSQQTQQRPATGPATTQQKNAGPAGTGPATPAKDEDEDEDETRKRILSSTERTARANGRPDIDALRAHGWKRVSAKQRAVLDEVADRHDLTGYEFAASAIRATPRGRDPLEAVMAADRMWQASARAKADADDAEWDQVKARDKVDAARVVQSDADLEALL